MIDIDLSRALHVAAIVHWIGGVSFVTLALLPGVRRLETPEARMRLFETLERSFSFQAKFSVTLAGLTGFYMTERLGAWSRFLDPGYWWMHAMALVWLTFTVVLFLLEPLVLHRWLAAAAKRDAEAAMRLVHRGHLMLLIASAVTVAAAVLGAHGALF